MRYLILCLCSLILSWDVFAGPESINLHIDTSYCAGNIQWIEKRCEQFDYSKGETQQCHFLPSPPNELFLTLKGEALIAISGVCKGHLRTCHYHFKPSLVRNVRYPTEVANEFPNGQTLNTTLIREELTYLKVVCE